MSVSSSLGVLHPSLRLQNIDSDQVAGPLESRRESAADDYLTVTLLASGLSTILRQRAGALWPGEAPGLLPASWRVGFSRLWWRFAQQGRAGLASDLDLLRLCAEPMASWPIDLALSESDLWNALLVGEELSPFAEQAARVGCHDVEAEWVENRVHQALRRAAEESGAEPGDVARGYARLRRYLVDHPVVADLDVSRLEQEFPKVDNSGQTFARKLINIAYRTRPWSGAFFYLRCPGCGNTVAEKGQPCGTAGCRGGESERASVKALAVIYEHHRATRRFVHDPGLVECRIIDALTAAPELADAVNVVPFPDVDALDVLIEFLGMPAGDGRRSVLERWGVDAKDQASARLLGRGFTWPAKPECDQKFLALPMHRAQQPGYTADLVAELDGRVAVTVIDERSLIRRVRARARELSR